MLRLGGATRLATAAIAMTACFPARADEQTACDPACAPGQTCVEGICLTPAARPPAVAPPTRAGFIAIPYAGINSFSGDVMNVDPGLHFGAILGGRVNDLFSANGEIIGDQVNISAPAAAFAWEYLGTVAFSPLFHLSAPPLDLVIGPRFGLWYLTGRVSDGDQPADINGRGWTLGVNVGAFYPINDTTSLGVLLSYATLEPTKACVTPTGSSEQCTTSGFKSTQVLGLTLAALF
jgi:hypothetical protein